jgi:hypothetical protein
MEKEIAGQEIDEDIELSVDDLFKDPEDSQTQDNGQGQSSDDSKNDGNENLTKNMTKRINEVRRKTELEVQDRVAKQAGYASYEDMMKATERKIVEDQGYDPDEINKLLEPLIEKRLTNDPRFKKLEEIESREKDAYLSQQLAAINKISDVKYKSVNDLPDETLNLFAKGVDLKQAFYATQGEGLLSKAANKANNGSLNHLAPLPNGNGVKTRGLNAEEKAMYRMIIPGITEEELSKKTIEID